MEALEQPETDPVVQAFYLSHGFDPSDHAAGGERKEREWEPPHALHTALQVFEGVKLKRAKKLD